jgi:protein CMS1
MSEDDNLQEPLIERLGPSPANVELPEGGLKKRKRGAEDGVKKASKKIPKKTSNSTKKRKDSGDDGLDIGAGINMAFANMDSQLVADYVTQRTRKHESDLSSVELEDRHIPGQDSL